VFYFVIQRVSDKHSQSRGAGELGEESDSSEPAGKGAGPHTHGDHDQPTGNGVAHAGSHVVH
jgi:hypothetical protein